MVVNYLKSLVPGINMVGCGSFSFLEKGVFEAIAMLEVVQQIVNLIFNKYLLSTL